MGLSTAGQSALMVAELLRSRGPVLTARPKETPVDPVLSDRPNDAGPGASWLPESLVDILPRRRTFREFGPDPVPVQCLYTIISRAVAAESQTWPQRVHGAASLAVLLAAIRVVGVVPGVYAVMPASQQVFALTDGSPLAYLRHEYADAAALLLIGGDPHQGVTDGSPVSYGSMLVRAGTLGYGAWLAAISVGLAGGVFGRTCSQATQAAQLLDVRLRHLFTVAIGSPAKRCNEPNDRTVGSTLLSLGKAPANQPVQ